jgi:hypothetical protein
MDGRHPSGGSRGLAQLVDEYGEHLAADLLEFYSVDLRDLFHPEKPLTPVFLLALIRGLPEDCRFNAERRGGQQFRGWDASRYAAVATVNAVRAMTYTYVSAHSKSRPKPPEPFPIPDSPARNQGPGSFAFIAARKLAAARKG